MKLKFETWFSYFRLIRSPARLNYTANMFARVARADWNESPPRPSGTPWWDIAIPVVIVAVGVWEASHNSSLPWRPVAIALAILLPWTLVIRRRWPLLAFLLGFTPGLVIDLVAVTSGVAWKAGASGIVVLMLAYSLFRWSSARSAAKGLIMIALVYAVTVVKGDIGTLAEAIAAAVVLLFAPTLGLAFRFRAAAQQQALDHVRVAEREQLARELHDTVAHHISAIAIQAQAGQAVAKANPAAAQESLSLIEEAASRTLGEMRTIVGALRHDRDAELVPQRGLGDLDELKDAVGPGIAVHLLMRGNLDGIRPSVEAAVYRLTQESVTNATRHALHPTRIDIEITGEADVIRVLVVDDGAPATHQALGSGFGLVGMQERASLLGGTFSAGPGPKKGWRVEAVLPRKDAVS